MCFKAPFLAGLSNSVGLNLFNADTFILDGDICISSRDICI